MKKAILILAAISLFGCKKHYKEHSTLKSFAWSLWETKNHKKVLSFTNINVLVFTHGIVSIKNTVMPVRFTNEDGFNEFIIDGYKPGMATSDTTLTFNNETYIKIVK